MTGGPELAENVSGENGKDVRARRALTGWDIAAATALFLGGTAFIVLGGALLALVPRNQVFGQLLGFAAAGATAIGVRALGGRPLHYWTAFGCGFVLVFVVGSGVHDLVLAERGKWTDARVLEIDYSVDRGGGEQYHCELEHLDGSRIKHPYEDAGCHESTEVGDRIRVIEDPGGLVAPLARRPDYTSELIAALIGVVLLALATALATVRDAGRRAA